MRQGYGIVQYLTAAEVTAGRGDNLPGVWIVVVDATSNVPTGDVRLGQAGAAPTVVQTAASQLVNNFTATAAPTAANDASQGYAVGSRWVDGTNDESYVCVDATTGAAVWSRTTVGTIGEVAGLQTALDAKEPTIASGGLAVAKGGTGATTAANARTNLGAEPAITAGTSGQYFRGDKTFQTLDKSAVGLGNADNTSDATKPVSTPQQTALDGKQPTLVSGTNVKTVNGASLLGAGNVAVAADLPGGAATTVTNEGLATTGSPVSSVVGADTVLQFNATGLFTVPLGVTSAWVLAVGGGGGGGSSHAGGGGGAGRLVEHNAVAVTPGAVHTVTVGGGGAGGAVNTQSRGGDGTASSFGTLMSAPGGGGGATEGGAGVGDGKNGGSGGGASGTNSVRTGGTATGGTGGGGTTANNAAAGYGNAGGAKPGGNYGVGAGGGGANAVGGDGADTGGAPSNTVNGGAGGAGRASNIIGTATTYGGGGGGGGWDNASPAQAANGGAGGGGRGGSYDQAPGNGTANTGGGGGGSHADGSTPNNSGRPGGNGGSGVVIVRFATQTRSYQALSAFAGDSAAATGGILVGQFYRDSTSGAVRQRVS